MSNKRTVILGCGHSGTTLLSGLLYFNNYNMLSVPTYTYECFFLNRLNERILNEKNEYFKKSNIQSYLLELEKHTKGDWVLKDPLLNYLMSDYDDIIQDDYKILFIYREPGKVINHIFKESKSYMPDKPDEDIFELAKQQWIQSNRYVLDFLSKKKNNFLIINYDDLLNYKGIEALQDFLGTELYFDFINKKLNRSSNIDVDEEVLDMYNSLEAMKREQNSEISSYNFKPKKDSMKFNIKLLKTKVMRKIFAKALSRQPVILRKHHPNA